MPRNEAFGMICFHHQSPNPVNALALIIHKWARKTTNNPVAENAFTKGQFILSGCGKERSPYPPV